MEIESLNKDPHVVSHDDVVEDGEKQFTGPVLKHTTLSFSKMMQKTYCFKGGNILTY